MKNVGNSSRGRSQGVMNIFRAPYRAHCAVIFATAQLSCLCSIQFELKLLHLYANLIPVSIFDPHSADYTTEL